MIIHVDMDAFYASVEIRDNPALKGKPVVVGGSPQGRGVICAASYEARKYGIHSAMPASQALRRCPHAVFVKGRMQHYAVVSRQIREIFFSFTSLVEPLSMDEAFLDVSGCRRLFGTGEEIARAIKQKIVLQTGLIASAGVAPNKHLAKIASDLEKPDGLTIVDPDRIQDFLDPLPIAKVWGIGPATERKFTRLGVSTIGQLRSLSLDVLKTQLGVNSEHFYRLARGIDSRPVVPDRIAKSISHEKTFAVDIDEDEVLLAWLRELCDQVGRRLRRHEIFARTIQLKYRFDDFETLTRRCTIERTCSTTAIYEAASEMLKQIPRHRHRGVRLIGLGVANLCRSAPVQLSLFDQEQNDRVSRVEKIKDTIRDRFGQKSLNHGTSLEHGIVFRPDPRINEEEKPL